MERVSDGKTSGSHGFDLMSSGELVEIRARGFDEVLGFVDQSKGVVYLPTIDCLNGRMASAGLSAQQFKNVMSAYADVGSQYEGMGFQRRHIIDG